MEPSDLNDLSNRISDVQGEISSLHGEINSLESQINRVDHESRDRDDELKSLYRELREELRYVRNNLESLMREIQDSFNAFNSSLKDLKEELEEIHKDTVEGNEKITTGIEQVEEVSRTGLQKVSSGVAIIDILKALTDAHQTTTSIERSLEETKIRYEQAKIALIKKREEFDKHFNLIEQGFNKQVQIIGQHIYELENLLPILNELKINESTTFKYNTVIREAQNEITAHRTRILEGESRKIDFNRLARFKELREKLDQLLSDTTILRLEELLTEETIEGLIPFGIPVDAILLIKNEFLSSEEDELRVYCLNAEGNDCYTKPESSIEYSALTKNIRGLCSRLKPENGVDLSREEIEGIKNGLKNLARKNMLREEHLELIEQHLNLYSLRWMES